MTKHVTQHFARTSMIMSPRQNCQNMLRTIRIYLFANSRLPFWRPVSLKCARSVAFVLVEALRCYCSRSRASSGFEFRIYLFHPWPQGRPHRVPPKDATTRRDMNGVLCVRVYVWCLSGAWCSVRVMRMVCQCLGAGATKRTCKHS